MIHIPASLQALAVPIDEVHPLEGNPRRGNIAAVAASLTEFGQIKPIVVRAQTGEILAGNHTWRAAKSLGWTHIAISSLDVDEITAKAIVLVDNRTSDLGEYDQEDLLNLLADVADADLELLAATAYSEEDILALLDAPVPSLEAPEGPPAPLGPTSPSSLPPAPPAAPEGAPEGGQRRTRLSLSDRFGVPPFTVLNGRENWWMDRKQRWMEMGLLGELGRDDKPRTWYLAPPPRHLEVGTEDKAERDPAGDPLLYGAGSTSVFDPVLCEILLSWFSPSAGLVLDPFAGGSSRGLVSALMGREYFGTDIRPNQIESNRSQVEAVMGDRKALVPEIPKDNLPDVTPVERLEDRGIWLKREDLYAFAGVRGAKVRTCRHFIEQAKERGCGVVTAGSRQSPQVNFVAQIAHRLGVPCRVHVPSGELTPELIAAKAAGATLVQHEYGYNTVIIKHAREDAQANSHVEIPYGMESQEAITFTKPQVANIPEGVSRIVNACGSGMTLAGILWGLKEAGRKIPVLAVCVGHVPEERLDKWAPTDWRETVEILDHPSDYHVPTDDVMLGDVQLDAWYEAKCIPHLQEGDLLWVSAIRPSAIAADAPEPIWVAADGIDVRSVWPHGERQASAILTCPPYGDLEVYSDDPRDLSTMGYEEFLTELREIMRESVELLEPNSFAVMVVGDFRDQRGNLRGFPAANVSIMQDLGLHLHNEAILTMRLTSLPLRVGRQFDATRKLGMAHQYVQVFLKGDAKLATLKCGPIVALEAP